MVRSLGRLTTLTWAPVLTISLVWGCAQSGVADITLDSDPTTPGDVDASWAPSPDNSGQKVPGKAQADSGSSSTDDDKVASSGVPSGSNTGAPDSGSQQQQPASGSKPTQGEVLITEVMYDPSGTEPANEWIELYNKASSVRMLSGLTIVDGGNRTHVIGAGISIAPGAYVVFARNKSAAIAAKVPSTAIVDEYGTGLTDSAGIQLANGTTGAVLLRDGSTTIAQADYGGWFSQSGSSIQLKTLTFAAGAQSSSWCLSSSTWATGSEKGTPGAAADCP